jgi:ketosteroid isomerase-like protein
MKLFKKNTVSQRIYKHVDDFQRAIQDGNYRAAREAVEKALKIDPLNKRLLEMKGTVLELVEMQSVRERPALSDVAIITKETDSGERPTTNDDKDIKTTLRSYGEALIAGDADAAASMWDKSSADLTFISADHSAVREGYHEIQDALRYAMSHYDYMSYALVKYSKGDSNLVYAFYEVRVAQLWDAYANVPGCKRVTLVLHKRGSIWKIIHGHESTFSCFE